MPKQQKSIDNITCGFNGCAKPATMRITFPLGFSARFCDECADFMIRKGLGKDNETTA